MMNSLISGLHYTTLLVTVCLVYDCMTDTKLNIGAIVKSVRHKAWVHKRHEYTFGCSITQMCHDAGVPDENLDYTTLLYPASVDITCTMWPDTEFVMTLIIVEHYMRYVILKRLCMKSMFEIDV